MRKLVERALAKFDNHQPSAEWKRGNGSSGGGWGHRGDKNTVWTDGVTLYSYAMPIARWEKSKTGVDGWELWMCSAGTSTMTTNGHISAVHHHFKRCMTHLACRSYLRVGKACWTGYEADPLEVEESIERAALRTACAMVKKRFDGRSRMEEKAKYDDVVLAELAFKLGLGSIIEIKVAKDRLLASEIERAARAGIPNAKLRMA